MTIRERAMTGSLPDSPGYDKTASNQSLATSNALKALPNTPLSNEFGQIVRGSGRDSLKRPNDWPLRQPDESRNLFSSKSINRHGDLHNPLGLTTKSARMRKSKWLFSQILPGFPEIRDEWYPHEELNLDLPFRKR